MTCLDVRLLGEFALFSNGAPVTTIKSQRLQCLLAYLLLHRDAPIARQHLAFLFWPDSSEAQARSNLRNLIRTLIQALPDGDRLIETDNQTVQWRADAACTVDVDSLLTTLANAHTENDLQHALDLYRGPLLPGCYDDWIAPERERLEQMLADVLQRFIDQWEQQGSYREAISYAQKLVRRDPLREDLYRQIMRLYAQSGDRAGVKRTFQECQAVLTRELDVEPSRQTQEAYDKYIRMEAPLPQPVPVDPVPVDAPAPPFRPPEPGPDPAHDVPERPITDEEIRKSIRRDVLERPTTEIPATAAALGVIYLLLFHPVLGLGDAAFFAVAGVSVLSLLAASASFVWGYVLNYEQAYTKKSQIMREQQKRTGIEQLRKRLIEGFTETRLADGHFVLRRLEEEYQDLQAVIARHREKDSITLSYLPPLVDETYQQALGILDDALELARATSSSHVKRLEAEIKELEDKVRQAGKQKGGEERVRVWQDRIDAGCRQLDVIEKGRLRLEGLLDQARKCQAALHDTRVQIASLKAETGAITVTAVLETLQRTIDQAKAVQEEMRRLGY